MIKQPRKFTSRILHLKLRKLFYKNKNKFVSSFKNWRTQLVHSLFGSEMYMCCSMNIEKHVNTLSHQQCREWTRNAWGNPGSNFFWFPVGCTNSLMSKFINEWNKYYMNIAKKMAGSLAGISRSISGTLRVQTVRSTILKCV